MREAPAPGTLHPTKLEPEQWVRSAAGPGAKYAVLVAKHTTGFALWDTQVNDFSIAHTNWRGGGGDVCREFINACNKYGLKPGFYYSTVCNGYYDINDNVPFGALTTRRLTVEITESAGMPVLRDVCVF